MHRLEGVPCIYIKPLAQVTLYHIACHTCTVSVGLLQPETLFLFGHDAFLDCLGKALFLRTLLLTERCVARLAAIESERGLAIMQHRAELLCAHAEESSKACELPLSQAGQFNCAILKFFHTSIPSRRPRAAFAMLRPRCMRSSRRFAATNESPKTRSKAV